MEPQQRLPLIPLRNANRVPDMQRARANQVKVNKIVSLIDQNNGITYCRNLYCGRLAVYTCKLRESRNYRDYCHDCFQSFRINVVSCEADSSTDA